jgi:ribosomal protein S18 acetylase RimI-like enzyme
VSRGDDVRVRPMTPADVPAIVELQRAFLDGSIVTQLGPRFLTAFHHAALEHPSSLAFVATEAGGAIGGFVLASLDVSAFNRHVKRRVFAALLGALVTPKNLPLVWRFSWSLVEAEPQPYVPAELLLLTVDANRRRQRIGQQLLAAVEDAFARVEVAQYRVAVRPHLAAARSFYLATGFESEQELPVLGQPMTYLIKRVAR